MGYVLNQTDFEAARSVRSAKLNELGVVPVCMAPGEKNEGHSHTLVEEVLIVQHGEGQIQIENQTFDLCAGSVAMVPAGQFHALCNTGKQNLEGIILFNSNVDRKQVDLKSREEHFNEPSTAQLCSQVDELTRANKKLKKKLKKLAKK